MITEIKKALIHGFEYFGLYYGTYRATVFENQDPEKRGRVQVLLDELGTTVPSNMWFDPSNAMGSGPARGSFWVPDIGDTVFVTFDGGNPSRPKCYFGGWYAEGELDSDLAPDPSDAIPYKRGFKTRIGHRLVFDDTPGKESLKLVKHKPWAGDPASGRTPLARSQTADSKKGSNSVLAMTNGNTLLADSSGSLLNLGASGCQILDQSGSYLTIDGTGIQIVHSSGAVINIASGGITIIAPNSLNITAPTITLSAGGIFVGPQKTELLSWLRTHSHSTGVGPSGVSLQSGLI